MISFALLISPLASEFVLGEAKCNPLSTPHYFRLEFRYRDQVGSPAEAKR